MIPSVNPDLLIRASLMEVGGILRLKELNGHGFLGWYSNIGYGVFGKDNGGCRIIW